MYKVFAAFADFKIEINTINSPIILFDDKYLTDECQTDFVLTTDIEQMKIEYKNGMAVRQKYIDLNMYTDEMMENYVRFYENMHICRQLTDKILDYDAFLLHSVAIDVGGQGIAFTAKSGTGKTTHLNLWKKVVGETLTVINGDKPIVRFFDGVPFACGTPWNGKEFEGCNSKTPLRDICFIERSETNSTVPMNKDEAFDRLVNQVVMPKDPIKSMKMLSLLDMLFNSCNFWLIKCNRDIEAAEVAYNTIVANEK